MNFIRKSNFKRMLNQRLGSIRLGNGKWYYKIKLQTRRKSSCSILCKENRNGRLLPICSFFSPLILVLADLEHYVYQTFPANSNHLKDLGPIVQNGIKQLSSITKLLESSGVGRVLFRLYQALHRR